MGFLVGTTVGMTLLMVAVVAVGVGVEVESPAPLPLQPTSAYASNVFGNRLVRGSGCTGTHTYLH